MAPPKKAKSAFLYFQSEKLSLIKRELGASMGVAMTELSSRWKNLPDEGKQRYLDLERKDRFRYKQESLEADRKALEKIDKKRQAQQRLDEEIQYGNGDDSTTDRSAHHKRGARYVQDQEREKAVKERRRRKIEMKAEMDPAVLRERKRRKQMKKAETEERQRKRAAEEKAVMKQHNKLDKEASKKSASRLEYLLKQSSIFSKLKMGGKDEQQQKQQQLQKEQEEKDKNKPHHVRGAKEKNDDVEEDEEEDNERHIFLTKQPSCIKFGKLKPYQIEALNWMIHLAEKGLNGILADEMGLGKTVQSIGIMAYHYEYLKQQGPYLVAVPKSTLSNWMNELKRWCPALRAIRFHGTKEQRTEMVENYFTAEAAAHDGKRPERQVMNEKGDLIDDNSENPRTWDVCVTTYEVCNTERKTLQKFAWKYLVIDEAHRLKNDASMFSKTVRTFRTSNRLLLTGTPLQNNLHELWALLNFLLPDIFSSSEQFDEWFDLEIDDEEAKKEMISQLHKVLRPFMLRRLKVDVAKGLPPKTETMIMVGMSKMQKKLYKQLLLRDLDSITGAKAGKHKTAVLNIVMQLRKCCGHPYLFEGMEDRTLDPLGDHLVDNCGKLSMVDKLLKKLKERESRVLIFTQMTRVLDILEDYMVMRKYYYCRIDGNTNYEDRENAIDTFNEPGSEKFCFLLSTRAGGLGINLQTADTVILYDSDWNPQQDLQAQDRCHRLGQKKPVNIYRLVSENTVEEKIVERAQQKLKLDAMVVQQGRLKDKDKVSKEEIMAAVRFGADTVFRSEDSTITNDDIDVILERGAARTKELAEKIQKADKGDLLDFRLDGGISAQTFEGIDYSDRDLRDHLRTLAANSMGKRERRPPPTSYNPIIHAKKSMIVNNRRIKLPRSLRLPSMEDHHFFNRERLLELGRLEFETYATLRELGQLPPREFIDQARTLLPPELAQEKLEMIDEGFGSWTRTQYYHFVKACAKYGRDDFANIAADMDMQEDSIIPYSKAFWKYGPAELKDEWERVVGNIERGEKKITKRKKLRTLLTKFISTFDNPRDEMVFANKGTTHFALEQDRALLCAVDKHGYGNWDSVREEIRNDNALKFQHTVQGMTTLTIGKRCDYRMRQMEKELEAREKFLKNKRPPTFTIAKNALSVIKEVDRYEAQAVIDELKGLDPPPLSKLSDDGKSNVEERNYDQQMCVDRLREIEAQLPRCKAVAEETREAILRGDQYVNYSNITLKAGGPSAPMGKDLNAVDVNGDIEARINSGILQIPECGQCKNCRESNGKKLCSDRLEVREKLIAIESKKLKELQAKGLDRNGNKKGPSGPTKKRKSDSSSVCNNLSSLSSSSSKKIKLGGTGTTALNSLGTSSKIKAPKLMMKKANGQLKPRVTSQGNKRMAIPDELFPEFCKRIGAVGTGERVKLINEFVDDYPTISVRQVTLKVSEVCTRVRPECVPAPEKKGGRAFMFYLRPRYYHILPADERPENWEHFAEEDEEKWQEEEKKKPASKKGTEEHNFKKIGSNSNTLKTSTSSSSLNKVSMTQSFASSPASSLATDRDRGDEIEEDD